MKSIMTYPNVAAEPAIYCPNVLIKPFGPGPNRMIFVAPKMKPMIKPTAGVKKGQFENVGFDVPMLTSAHHCAHFDYEQLAVCT